MRRTVARAENRRRWVGSENRRLVVKAEDRTFRVDSLDIGSAGTPYDIPEFVFTGLYPSETLYPTTTLYPRE